MFRYIFSHSKKWRINLKKSRAIVLLEIFSGFQNTIWICFDSKIVISNSNWVNMSKSEKIIFFSKKSRFSLKILKNVQKYWQSLSHPNFIRIEASIKNFIFSGAHHEIIWWDSKDLSIYELSKHSEMKNKYKLC